MDREGWTVSAANLDRMSTILKGLIVALAATLAVSSAGADAPTTSRHAPAIHAAALRGTTGCGAAAACTSRAVTGPIGTRIAASQGLADWVRLAADLHGSAIGAVAIPRMRARDALDALYAELDVAVFPGRIAAATDSLSAEQDAAVGDLVTSVWTAHRLSARAIAGTGIEQLDALRAAHVITASSSGLRDVSVEQELARTLDALDAVNMDLMATAAAVLADAIERFPRLDLADDIDLPLVFIGGSGDDVHADDRVILIDEGGNDTYPNNAGGALLETAGSAIAVDRGDGADVYRADRGAQGFGEGGVGILLDEGGADSYSLHSFGQGGTFGGIGVLYDEGPEDDLYLSPHLNGAAPIGTKAASLGGIGMLIDEGGSNVYHQDGLDGLVWGAGGGLGLLASLGDGDDLYRADEVPVELLGTDLGTFAGPIMGSSEAYGAIVLYDEAGNDTYRCGDHVRQGCQSAAGPGSFALLWDVEGDDSYLMGESISPLFFGGGASPIDIVNFPMGQASAYGWGLPAWGPAFALLRDEDGEDRYVAEHWAQGHAVTGGTALLYDTGGDADVYATASPLVGTRGDGQTWADGSIGFGADE